MRAKHLDESRVWDVKCIRAAGTVPWREYRGMESMTVDKKNEFEQAGEDEELSFFREFLVFLVENKAWWIVPIVVVLALVGVLAAFSATGAAPFIYALF